jgi:hypothetical protein
VAAGRIISKPTKSRAKSEYKKRDIKYRKRLQILDLMEFLCYTKSNKIHGGNIKSAGI